MFVHHDVFRLDVSMDYLIGMDVVKACYEACNKKLCEFFTEVRLNAQMVPHLASC
jgi:hypothetical protein